MYILALKYYQVICKVMIYTWPKNFFIFLICGTPVIWKNHKLLNMLREVQDSKWRRKRWDGDLLPKPKIAWKCSKFRQLILKQHQERRPHQTAGRPHEQSRPHPKRKRTKALIQRDPSPSHTQLTGVRKRNRAGRAWRPGTAEHPVPGLCFVSRNLSCVLLRRMGGSNRQSACEIWHSDH